MPSQHSLENRIRPRLQRKDADAATAAARPQEGATGRHRSPPDRGKKAAAAASPAPMPAAGAPSARASARPAGPGRSSRCRAGQHDLEIPARHQRAHLLDDRADRYAAVASAPERDHAERAAMVAALLHLHEGPRPAGKLRDQVRRGLRRLHDVGHGGPGIDRPILTPQFSTLPSTRETPGRAAQVSGEICAAQPVTTMLASGCSRCARRIACRACRSASAVTAQVLTMIVSDRLAAWPRITSLS